MMRDEFGARDPRSLAINVAAMLIAFLAFVAMIDFTLGAARSSRYKHAARHLYECASLARRLADIGEVADHVAYEQALRAAHGRKTAFWQEVEAFR